MNRQSKIHLLSNVLYSFFIFLFIFELIVFILCWLNFLDPQSFTDFIFDTKAKILYQPSLIKYTILFLIAFIPTGISMFIYYKLITLFQAFRNNNFFDINNILILKTISITLFVLQIIKPLQEALFTLTATFHNPPGHGLMTASFSSTNLLNIAIAGIILLTSLLLVEICSLKKEQELTI